MRYGILVLVIGLLVSVSTPDGGAAEDNILKGIWVWQSGIGPAFLTVDGVEGDGKVSGSYVPKKYPQHKSVFNSGDGSEATYEDEILSIKLKSGSSFELSLFDGSLEGEFTRKGNTSQVTFNKDE